MPSGITADIYEGKDVTLRDYLMRVGRQMGFAIMQRDAPYGAPVREVEPSDYHAKALAEARERLAWLDELSLDDAAAEAGAEYDREMARWTENRDKRRALRDRYEAMLEEVRAWTVPPILEGTKEHAIKYLVESVKFDCGEPGDEMRYYPTPQLLGAPVWLDKQREKARHDIDYHQAEHEKEIERTRERNEYIRAFLDSLPTQVAA